MGFNICYVAVKADAKQAAKLLDLPLFGESSEMPEGRSWLAHLKQTGWTIAFIEDGEILRKYRKDLLEASKSADLVLCEAFEMMMWSSAEYLTGGTPLWRVAHDGQKADKYHLLETGQLPAQYAQIKAAHIADQKGSTGVDHIFSIPVELAKAITGYAYTQYLTADDTDCFYFLD